MQIKILGVHMSTFLHRICMIIVFSLAFSAFSNAQDKNREVDVIYSKLSKVLPEGSALMAYPYADKLSMYGEKGSAIVNEASDAIGGKAYEVSTKKTRNPWDIGVTSTLIQDVKKGDVLHFTFFAKALDLPEGQDAVVLKSVGVQKSSEPYNALFGKDLSVGEGWQSFTLAGTADKDYLAGELQATFQVGTADQRIAFGPLLIFNVGNGVDPASLPYVQ
jgi:hypothetical protein